MKAVVSHFDDRYHAPENGFYCEYGTDFDPDYAGRIERVEAIQNGYNPCDECGLSEDDDLGKDVRGLDMVQRQIDAGYREYDDYRYPGLEE